MTKKDKIQLAVTGVLVIFLVLMTVKAFKPRKKNAKPPSPAASKAVAQRSNHQDMFTRLDKEAQQYQWQRDPFSVPVVKVNQGLILMGIVWDDETPMAIINNNMVEKGSVLDGFEIIDIQKDGVLLNNGKEDLKLSL